MPDGTTPTPVSLRIPADLVEKLDRVAAAFERPRSWVMLRALQHYLADEGQEMLDIQEGIAELDRGEGVPLDDVLAEIDAKIAELETKRAAE
jgi:predicted transcriptional regulator